MDRAKTNGMSVAALVMSGLTVILGSNLIFALMAGGLGITFALLSRGDRRMSVSSKVALIVCIVGIIASIIITAYMMTAMVRSGAMEYYIHMFEDAIRQQQLY